MSSTFEVAGNGWNDEGSDDSTLSIVRQLNQLGDSIAHWRSLTCRLERIEAILTKLEGSVRELRSSVGERSRIKQSYSTAEVAAILGKRPFTVREWCRLGRIRAEKAHSGRGSEPEWRISHDELERIQNEGLLPIPRRY